MSTSMNVATVYLTGVLSEKYGFDKSEALAWLGLAGEEPKRKGVVPPEKRKKKVPMPWLGAELEGGCQALSYNLGLFTQCEGEVKGGRYCVKCEKARGENNGESAYGTVEERKNPEFAGGGGKGLVPYGNVLEKKGISRETAEEYARSKGVEIPSEMFAVVKKKRGRPKKVSVEVTDTDEEGQQKKKRGRPKKKATEENPVDLIANLVAQVDESPEKSGGLGAEVLPEKDGGSPEKYQELVEEEPVEDSPTDTVTEFTHNGKTYFRSTSTAMLYDSETQDPVGQWNEEKGVIIELEVDFGSDDGES